MATNESHGPLALVLICLSKPTEGCGGVTVRVAPAGLPLTVCALIRCDTLPLVLLYVPLTGAVMLTVTMQVPPAASEPPEKLIEPAPADGAKVGAPQPEVVALGVPATTIEPGEVGKV